MARFVNPYTFVPLVAEPKRESPAGHALMDHGRFSGVLKIRLTARTPLLIGGFNAKDSGKPDVPRQAAGDRKAIVPGSGLLGATRSVHEALAGGCMRVLDADWVPVHRHPASLSETRDIKLAVVTEVDGDGRATKVALCDDWIWIPRELLPADGDRLPRTGDHLRYQSPSGRTATLPEHALTGPATRRVVRRQSKEHPNGLRPGDLVRTGQMGVPAADCLVLLVTDTHVRQAAMPVYFAAGRAGPGSRCCDIPPGAWERYQDLVAGANDMRPAALVKAGFTDRKEPARGAGPPEYEDVCWPPGDDARADQQPIGRRLRARTYLHPGQPVWVRVHELDHSVTEIRLSLLWRYQGEGTVGERAGNARPCTDPEKLCWSCRTFGSASTEGRGERDLAVQNSYRGHVRSDDLVATGDVKPLDWNLAPLASPRPSAGQFYLATVPGSPRLARRNTRPAATWGSLADQPRRPISGRKFYWRTADPVREPHPRGAHRPHQSGEMGGKVALVPAGTVFTGRVCFDNLGTADYGSLLAALDPRLLAEVPGGQEPEGWSGVVTSIGGGKPFGFGSVTIDVEPVLIQTANGRYLDETDVVPGVAEAVRAFRDKVPRPVSETWDAVQHALTFGFVPDELVWYPPGLDGAKGSQEFDQSFEFFTRTAGLELKDEIRELVELPAASAPAAGQVLDSRMGRRPRAEADRENHE